MPLFPALVVLLIQILHLNSDVWLRIARNMIPRKIADLCALVRVLCTATHRGFMKLGPCHLQNTIMGHIRKLLEELPC